MDIDQNPGLIQPFMTQNKFTFTVLPAYNYASDQLKVMGIPQNWVIDPAGVVRLKGIGYDANGDWQKGIASALQKFSPQPKRSNLSAVLPRK